MGEGSITLLGDKILKTEVLHSGAEKCGNWGEELAVKPGRWLEAFIVI